MNLIAQAAQRIASSSPRTVEARALLERLGRLNARDGFTLTHALQIAAERFDSDAATFDQVKADAEAASRDGTAERGVVPMFNPVSAGRLAGQFRQQAADVRELLAVLEGDDDEEEAELGTVQGA